MIQFNRFARPAAVAALLLGAPSAALAQAGPARVDASPVIEREISTTQPVVGTVMPLRKAIIGSAVDGRVIEFPRGAGDRVEEGEKLAQLLTETIVLELASAEAELRLRQQEELELRNGSRPEEIEQARARMSGAEAEMKYLQARRARFESLYRNNRTVTEEERDAAISAAISAEQAFAEALAAHQMAVAGQRKERIAQAEAQVAMSAAAVARLKDQIDKHTIVSRFAGYVTAEHTEVGQWVKQGDPVAEVVALDEVEVVVQLVEQYVPFVRVGAVVPVEVPAITGRRFTGQVKAIVPQADVQARTFPVEVRVKNELVDGRPLIKAGMYARVALPTGRSQMALLVPKDALVLGGPQPVVFVVEPTANGLGNARPAPVQLGAADGDLIQVSGGVSAGQLVVVKGNERLPPAEQEVMLSIVKQN
jgi:RND family efflux transporter MFP subunit